jgi:solute carrier family 66, member 2
MLEAFYSLFSIIIDCIVISGVVWPYYPQAVSILKSKNHKIFSPFVSGILIVANTIRIAFYFQKPFELALLIQSVAAIITQLIMLYVVVSVKDESRTVCQVDKKYQTRVFLDFNINYFFKWDTWVSYLQFECALVLLLFILHALFSSSSNLPRVKLPSNIPQVDFYWYGELLGILALGIEGCLPLPQVYQNYELKSTKGLSRVMIGSWILGDSLKTFYSIVKKVPFQFAACGITQLLLDFVILYQILVLYPDNSNTVGAIGSGVNGNGNANSSSSIVNSNDSNENIGLIENSESIRDESSILEC